MALADIDLVTEEVSLPNGKSFPVRGLSLSDVTVIVRKHAPEVQAFFARYIADREMSGGKGPSPKAAADIGFSLLESTPSLAAEVIAHAADDPSQAGKVMKFPMGVQMDALERIARLTFEAEGGAKKFGEAVVRLLQGTTSLMTDLNLSTIGSMASGGK